MKNPPIILQLSFPGRISGTNCLASSIGNHLDLVSPNPMGDEIKLASCIFPSREDLLSLSRTGFRAGKPSRRESGSPCCRRKPSGGESKKLPQQGEMLIDFDNLLNFDIEISTLE